MQFLDTNILLYAVSTVADEEPKAKIALGLLEQEQWTLSVQVSRSSTSRRPERPVPILFLMRMPPH